jgi:hypothetical protein
MFVRLHSQATTIPKIRAAIQASNEPAWVLAERHRTTEQTVWKWRKRDSKLRHCFRTLGYFTPVHERGTKWDNIEEHIPKILRQAPLIGFMNLAQLKSWRLEIEAFGSPEAKRHQKADAAELDRLHKDNKRLALEVEILHKASAFFATRAVKPS